jgi:large subunit ribosomal protein L22
MAETKAHLNNIRIAPRKVRSVANMIKGKDVVDAIDQMEHFARRSAPSLRKLLLSAVANAENNYQMVKENLYIKEILVNEGMKLKRFMPRARGRATEIQKKTSKVTVILDERVAGMKKTPTKQKKEETQDKQQPSEGKQETTTSDTKPEIKQEIKSKKKFFGGLGKKIFRRKSV